MHILSPWIFLLLIAAQPEATPAAKRPIVGRLVDFDRLAAAERTIARQKLKAATIATSAAAANADLRRKQVEAAAANLAQAKREAHEIAARYSKSLDSGGISAPGGDLKGTLPLSLAGMKRAHDVLADTKQKASEASTSRVRLQQHESDVRQYLQTVSASASRLVQKRYPRLSKSLSPYRDMDVALGTLLVFRKDTGVSQPLRVALERAGWLVKIADKNGTWAQVALPRDQFLVPHDARELDRLLGSLLSVPGVGSVMPNTLLYPLGNFQAESQCFSDIAAGTAPTSDCLAAAQALHLPEALALLSRLPATLKRSSVSVAVLDAGFTKESSACIQVNATHGDNVEAVIKFATGRWMTPSPITIEVHPCAPSTESVTPLASEQQVYIDFAAFLGVLPFMATGVTVTNVSLGYNEAMQRDVSHIPVTLFEDRAKHEHDRLAIVGRQWTALIVSAAGNDQSCPISYKATWSSPLNAAADVLPIQVVGSLKFDPTTSSWSPDKRSNDSDAALFAPSAEDKGYCYRNLSVPFVETSYATPYVTGIVALVAAVTEDSEPSTVLREIIRQTARNGMPNAFEAVVCALHRKDPTLFALLRNMPGAEIIAHLQHTYGAFFAGALSDDALAAFVAAKDAQNSWGPICQHP
ncbi:MAG TPA: S8 family serine peptidase [Thermoanaerobaculia bacterium]|nr:S8 family serine peptidase [Thermoanaerobaculia bacterium]